MPLRAWYPLNGTVANKGAGSFELTQTTAPTWATGKTAAQALNAGAFNWTAAQTASIMNNEAFSYAAWIYVGDSDTRSMIFGSNITPRRFCLFQYPTKNDFHYSWATTDSGSNFVGVVTGALPTGKWTHVAAVYQKGHAWFYINGELRASGTPTVNITSYNAQTNVIHNNSNHRLQDVRIYDHALSQKEVVELAKGLMLHIPMYAGYPNVGTNIAKSTSSTPVAYSVGQYYTRIQYDTNFYGLAAGDTFTYGFKVTAPADRGIYARVQYYTDGDHRVSVTNSNTIPAGTTGYTYLTSTISTNQRGYNQMELLLNNSDSSLTSTTTCYVSEIKLERGSVRTPWSPDATSGQYTPDYAIKDCSGYQKTVGTTGTVPTIGGDSPRYGMSAKFDGAGACLWPISDPITSSATEFTISLWFKTTTVSATQCIWNGRTTIGAAVAIFIIDSSLRIDDSNKTAVKPSLAANTWYHLAVTWKSGGNKVTYINGVQQSSVSAGTLSKSNTKASIGRSSSADTLASSNYFSGQMSDFRIYATALTADQVKELYNTPISVANTGACLSEQFTEGASSISFAKTGIASCKGLFTRDIIVEPDGSKWIQVSHHVNPTTYKFSSSDPFITGVWKDAYRFLDGGIMGMVDKWEFLVVQKATADAVTCRYRWSQTKNPNTAVFADVAAANVTKKGTADGYTAINSSYGGIYKFNSNTFYCANNSNNGNWWGAIGAWGAHNGGIPGYNGVVVKDGGFQDLYLRIDNVTWSPTKADFSLDKDGLAVLSPEFIEQ